MQTSSKGQEHWTPEQFRKHIGQQASGGKYGNRKIEIDGHEFSSQKEANRYCELKIMYQAGQVKGFGIQPSFYLSEGIRYIADFIVCDHFGHIWLEDTKGYRTKDFNIKQKLMQAKYPWLELKLL